MHDKVLNTTIKYDDAHRKHLHLQLHRSLSEENIKTSKRYMYLINRLREIITPSNMRFLCVRCRSVGETNYFKSIGAKRVIRIDLFSESEDIMIMDA